MKGCPGKDILDTGKLVPFPDQGQRRTDLTSRPLWCSDDSQLPYRLMRPEIVGSIVG